MIIKLIKITSIIKIHKKMFQNKQGEILIQTTDTPPAEGVIPIQTPDTPPAEIG